MNSLLNHVYRIVWSDILGSWHVVIEVILGRVKAGISCQCDFFAVAGIYQTVRFNLESMITRRLVGGDPESDPYAVNLAAGSVWGMRFNAKKHGAH